MSFVVNDGRIGLGAKGRVAQNWKLAEAKHMSQHTFRASRRWEARQRIESRLLELQLELARVKQDRDTMSYELAGWTRWWVKQWQERAMNGDTSLRALVDVNMAATSLADQKKPRNIAETGYQVKPGNIANSEYHEKPRNMAEKKKP